MSDDQDIFRQIFFPDTIKAKQRVIENGGKFAHYTTAATAQLILKNKELWMRSTAMMNDTMEIEHGLKGLNEFYNSQAGTMLKAAIDECFPGLSNELTTKFNDHVPTIKKHTYILSVSEHSESENEFGRLSMWRAYGGNAGVALIFNGGVILRPSNALNAYSYPVAYRTSDGIAEELKKITLGIRQHKDYVRSLGREKLIETMLESFRFATICTKHSAFLEEREWRLISTQVLHKSERLSPVCEVIGGIPQLLLKLKLEDHVEEDLYGLTMPSFLDRILIGPCEHPETIKAALSSLLAESGIPDPDSRIHITNVPLRSNHR
jgi:hypothetical protein